MKSTAHAVVVDDGDAVNLHRCAVGGYHGVGSLGRAVHRDVLHHDFGSAGSRRALIIAAAGGSAVDAAVVAVEAAVVALRAVARLGDGTAIHSQRTTSTLYDIIILCGR